MGSLRPIGIFDSGIGGLTVADAMRRQMPAEDFVYFGDTAHLPYGDKSPEAVKSYALGIAQFLLKQKCKAIVIACNTASSVAYDACTAFVRHQVPVYNVIDPVAIYVFDNYSKGKIGVIGTKGTVKSRIYPRKINKLNKSLKVASLATPLLAPMIEEGFFNNKISRTIIDAYLKKPGLKDIDALILGCTHYPLIRKEVSALLGKQVEVIDTAEVVAAYIRSSLKNLGILSHPRRTPKHRFFVSDFTPAFERSTKYFFKQGIHLQQLNIWDTTAPH